MKVASSKDAGAVPPVVRFLLSPFGRARIPAARLVFALPMAESSRSLRSPFQTAKFDALGRRMKKVVTNAGEFDKTEVYLYEGHKIIETRLAGDPNNAYQQFIHGTQYIDELVMVRVKGKGDLYVHQDANWNVIGLTDLGGRLVERHLYTPYGELTVHQATGFGDRDGDSDVDSTDKGTPGTTCTGTVTGSCRILDLDFDGDYDSSDATLFDSLDQGLMIHPGRMATNVDQPFAHQGLLFEPEIGSYQNRARQYDPAKRRFVQRDPLSLALPVFDPSLHYVDGANLYEYLRSAPGGALDPTGTAGVCKGVPLVGSSCTTEHEAGVCCVGNFPCRCWPLGATAFCSGTTDATVRCKCIWLTWTRTDPDGIVNRDHNCRGCCCP